MKQLFFLSLILISIFGYAQNCPTALTVSAYNDEIPDGSPATFSVSFSGGGTITPSYNWSISAGTIISGQGTSTITVNTEDLAGGTITATVELGGFAQSCSVSQSATISVSAKPAKTIKWFTGANFTPKVLNAKMKSFAEQSKILTSYPPIKAFVYVYPAQKTTTAQLAKIRTAIGYALESNNLNALQYKIVDGGKRSKMYYEVYSLPEGAAEPEQSR